MADGIACKFRREPRDVEHHAYENEDQKNDDRPKRR
jgi:hypothetical protein